MHKYIADTGKWSWYASGGHRRLSFDDFEFYAGDRCGFPIGKGLGHPGYWSVPVGHDGDGRARLCLNIDAYDRYFIWRAPADGIDVLAQELARGRNAATPVK